MDQDGQSCGGAAVLIKSTSIDEKCFTMNESHHWLTQSKHVSPHTQQRKVTWAVCSSGLRRLQSKNGDTNRQEEEVLEDTEGEIKFPCS